MREGDDGRIETIEQKVTVNHARSVVTDEPIYCGEQGYTVLNEDTDLNFTGGEMTFEEYMQGEFEETQSESQQSGGMQL